MTGLAAERTAFIDANTAIVHPPLVPEVKLRLADEAYALWHKTEEQLQQIGLPLPFWAFAWAGGQALARYILDEHQTVAGKTVLDVASGSGVVAIAAKLAGATHVTANDIDAYAHAAMDVNARLNAVEMEIDVSDHLAGDRELAADIVLAGDIFYDRELAEHFWPRLLQAAASGKTVLIGDPGRSYLPAQGLKQLAQYDVPVTRALEDSEFKRSRVFAVEPA